MVKEKAPELFEQVKTGSITLNQAANTVKKDEKKKALEAKAAEVSASLASDTSPRWKILDGNCIKHMQGMESQSVRLVFADPPYNIGIKYGKHYNDAQPVEDYLRECESWIQAIPPLLTPDGSFFLLVNQENAWRLIPFAIRAGLHLRQWITWFESFGTNCPGKYNRCSRALLWFVNDPVRFIWNPSAVNRKSDRQTEYDDKRADPDGKVWDDVWGIKPDPIPRLTGTCEERLPGFPTQLPLALLRPIIGAHSEPDDLVLDPFSGSGTTGAICIELDRRFIGIELSQEFAELARKRLLIASKEAEHARTGEV